MSVAVSVAVSCRSAQTLPLHAASSSVRTAVRSAVSWSAHNRAMIRLRSTHDDRLTSLSSRTTRHLATIEAARARHSLDDVARLASHDHFERSPSLQLHLDDGIWHCLGCGQTGDVVERVYQSEAVGWRQAIRILDSGCALTRRVRRTRVVALAQGLFFKSTSGGKVLRDSRRGCRDDP